MCPLPRELINRSENAISKEIEAVRERPSSDLLVNGKKANRPAGQQYTYHFKSANNSLRHAEECRAMISGRMLSAVPVESDQENVWIKLSDDCGEHIQEIELEWENDFVLRAVQQSLEEIRGDSGKLDRVSRLLNPGEQAIEPPMETYSGGNASVTVRHDGSCNFSQLEAVQKAMGQPVSFVWGPPGTGKTATLACIIANYVLRGQTVLFVSNTNRAVDHGMIGVYQIMERLNMKSVSSRITRFGECVLDHQALGQIHFDRQIQQKMNSFLQKAADLQNWLDAAALPGLTAGQKRHFEKKIKSFGGEEAMREQIGELGRKENHAYVQVRKFDVLGTTLARVCTSDLLHGMDFDAVVVDEASMAHLPFMLVVASRAKEHLVIAGDPMQLPPIALTRDTGARQFLEKDIFSLVSGAKTTSDLFGWHDRYPECTTFFHIQYRMPEDLARVISEVFYEGRLITAGPVSGNSRSSENGLSQDTHPVNRPGKEVVGGKVSVSLLDSSFMGPVLRQEKNRRGFHPVNEVHVSLLKDVLMQFILVSGYKTCDIGIIVPFRSSVWHLNREIKKKNSWHDLEIGTIHTFQGREKKVILLDTVMSGEVRGGEVSHYSVRPFDEQKNGMSVPRLLNVAFSRSRECLVVVADMNHIRKIYSGKFLDRLLKKLPVRSIEEL